MGNSIAEPFVTAGSALPSRQDITGDRNLTIERVADGTAIANVEGQEIHIGAQIYQSQAEPEAIRQIVREVLRSTQQQEYGAPVKQGLLALADLMQTPEVKSAVVTYRVKFEAVSQRIEDVANYKALHDLLHRLYIDCYNGIIREVRRFPDEEEASDNLMLLQITLQELLSETQKFVAQNSGMASEVMWLQDLERAQAELAVALDRANENHLKRAIGLLNRILAIYPSRINTSLNITARHLSLPQLLEAMGSILSQLQGAAVDAQKLCQFRDGLDVLSQLNQRLDALIVTHNDWQGVDLQLRLIESARGQHAFELEVEGTWPDLQAQAQQLLEEQSTNLWNTEFQKTMARLDEALSERNPSKIRRYFNRFRQLADKHFFQVDVALKQLCEELRQVGQPLAAVLQLLE